MKALKYGMTLVLGLSLSVCGAQVFAQSSGQSQTVTPEHPNTLPEVPAAGSEQPTQQSVEGQPQRGIPTPKAIELLVEQRSFDAAVSEFEKFIKTAKADPCNLIYLRYSFYDRLVEMDSSKDEYKAKRDSYFKEMESKCAQMPDLFFLKARLDPNQNPETTIQWMDKVIEIDPSYGEAYGVRGDAYWRLGQTQKACVDFKKAKELDPNYVNNNYESQCAEYEK